MGLSSSSFGFAVHALEIFGNRTGYMEPVLTIGEHSAGFLSH
jgi:hypothetical protein